MAQNNQKKTEQECRLKDWRPSYAHRFKLDCPFKEPFVIRSWTLTNAFIQKEMTVQRRLMYPDNVYCFEVLRSAMQLHGLAMQGSYKSEGRYAEESKRGPLRKRMKAVRRCL